MEWDGMKWNFKYSNLIFNYHFHYHFELYHQSNHLIARLHKFNFNFIFIAQIISIRIRIRIIANWKIARIGMVPLLFASSSMIEAIHTYFNYDPQRYGYTKRQRRGGSNILPLAQKFFFNVMSTAMSIIRNEGSIKTMHLAKKRWHRQTQRNRCENKNKKL